MWWKVNWFIYFCCDCFNNRFQCDAKFHSLYRFCTLNKLNSFSFNLNHILEINILLHYVILVSCKWNKGSRLRKYTSTPSGSRTLAISTTIDTVCFNSSPNNKQQQKNIPSYKFLHIYSFIHRFICRFVCCRKKEISKIRSLLHSDQKLVIEMIEDSKLFSLQCVFRDSSILEEMKI